MHPRSIFLLLASSCALSACLTTVPPAQPSTQTIVAIAPANVPGVAGVAGTAGDKSTLTTTTAKVVLTQGEERVMNDVLRNQSNLAPTGGVLWLSSDSNVATINPLSGQVKAKAPGTTLLTASLQSAPDVQAQIQVTVTATGKTVQISVIPANPSLLVGERVKLMAEVHLADGSINSNVDWSSSDNTVATVNPTTGEVNGVKPGRVTIKGAYSQDGTQFGVANVAVAAASPVATAVPIVATPTPSPLVSPTASPKASATPTAAPTPSPSPSPTATPTPTVSPSPSATPTAAQ